MKAKLEWMNVTYDVEFAAPSFDLPVSGTTVLRTLYETIHPRYPIRIQDMQVVGGNLLSDVHARITLFNGNAFVDVSADKMSLVFQNLKDERDVAVFRDCISLSEEALQSSLPNVTVRAVALKPTMYLELGGGQVDAGDYLSRAMGPTIELDQAEFEGAVSRQGANLEIENSKEGWNAAFHAVRDHSKQSSLILWCHALYATEGKVCGLENRVAHLERLLKAFFERIALEMPDSTA